MLSTRKSLVSSGINGWITSSIHLSDTATAHEQALDALEVEVIEALCWMEAYWPVDDQTSQLHLILHLPQQIREFGPLQESWMFPFEGFIGILKGNSQGSCMS